MFNISKDKLLELYAEQNLTAKQIAVLFGFKSNCCVIRKLKEYNIEIKGIRHYLIRPRINFTKEQYEFFDGLIASDGCLNQQITDHHNRNASISCKFKYKEFAEHINNYLGLGCDIKKYIHVSDRYKNGYCENYVLYSKNNLLYTDERKRWYPDGKKILPDDFRFSPISINIMYLGDGWIRKNKKIYICTQAFDKDNVEKVLVNGFANIGIICKIQKDGQLYFNQENSRKFLNYIGKCPVECYKYKWDF